MQTGLAVSGRPGHPLLVCMPKSTPKLCNSRNLEVSHSICMYLKLHKSTNKCMLYLDSRSMSKYLKVFCDWWFHAMPRSKNYDGSVQTLGMKVMFIKSRVFDHFFRGNSQLFVFPFYDEHYPVITSFTCTIKTFQSSSSSLL